MGSTKGTTIAEFGVGGKQDKLKWEGLNTSIKDPRFLNLGQTYDSMNWITGRDGDNIQLRRGSILLGTTRRAGGNVTGLGVGILGQIQVPFFSAGRSVFYYNAVTGDTAEVNVLNLLPVAASGEDVTFVPYQNLAGSFIYLVSPHSSWYKIPIANPGDAVDQQVSSFRFAFARVDQNRMWGVGRYGTSFSPDLTSTYISNTDKSTYSAYGSPTVDFGVGTGDGVTTAFSNTLTQAAPQTLFNILVGGAITAGTTVTAMTASAGLVTITSNAHGRSKGDFIMVEGVSSTGDAVNGNIMTVTSVTNANVLVASPTSPVATFSYGSGGTLYPLELFVDQAQGTLTSNQGGTGTINYATGAISVNFITPPVTATKIVGNYYVENATSGGILDFSFSTGSPSIGQGYQFSQGGGGSAISIAGFQGVEYIFHSTKSWVIGLPTSTGSAYSDATNNEYWSHIGVPYPRSQYPTGDGILYLDNTNPSVPKYSELQIPPGSTNLTVVPQWISQDLDLAPYTFSKAVAFRWGEYNVLACQTSLNGIVQPNNTLFFIQNIYSNKWNLLDYSVTSLAEYLGALISGDSLSPNIEVLFSGLDDDGDIIPNHWNMAYTDFGFNGLKKVRYLTVEGLIQRDQQIQIGVSLDEGSYITVFTIDGNGPYVNNSSPIGVGSNTLGSSVIDGGGGVIFANPFTVDIPIYTDYFQDISVQFEALAVGWAQIDRLAYKSISLKRMRLSAYAEGTQL